VTSYLSWEDSLLQVLDSPASLVSRARPKRLRSRRDMLLPTLRPSIEPTTAPATVAMVLPEPPPIWCPAMPPRAPPSTAPVSPPVQLLPAQPTNNVVEANRATSSVIDLCMFSSS